MAALHGEPATQSGTVASMKKLSAQIACPQLASGAAVMAMVVSAGAFGMASLPREHAVATSIAPARAIRAVGASVETIEPRAIMNGYSRLRASTARGAGLTAGRARAAAPAPRDPVGSRIRPHARCPGDR